MKRFHANGKVDICMGYMSVTKGVRNQNKGHEGARNGELSCPILCG